jgi:hypothetical protein
MNRIKLVLPEPWIVSVNEMFDVDYSLEDNCLMWGDTLFHAWRPLDGGRGGRRVIDVSNKDGVAFGVVVGLVQSGMYQPIDGRRCHSINETVNTIAQFSLEWKFR